ncbi:MAG: hypothetical protein LUH18_04095 [Oscillospiraceae bacterium]|nr:hypothetical protein [Oscillospiraceae bacterium]
MEAKKSREQAANIEALLKDSDEKNSKSSIIQEAYLKYCETMSESDLSELFRLLDSYSQGYVRRQLHEKGLYSQDTEYDVMTDAKLEVWNHIRKNRSEKKENFANYAFGIYRNKVNDLIRKASRSRKRMPTSSLTGEDGEDIDVGVVEEQRFSDNNDRISAMEKLVRIYCETFLNLASATRPASALLALCYARALPHMLEEIPDNKATSAKWAYERMGDKSVYSLRSESEGILTEWFCDRTMVWGESFLSQLSEPIPGSEKSAPLGEEMYTERYSKERIEDWADSMHKATMREAVKVVSSNKELMETIREGYSSRDVLQKFRKGETR